MSTKRKFSKNETKTGFLLSSGVNLVRPLNWNSKIGRYSITNFEEVTLNLFSWPFTKKKTNKIQNQAIRIKPITFTQNSKMRRHCSKLLQETAHKIWLILKPKTYCFSPSLDIYWQDSSNPQGLHRQNPAKNSNTLERLSKKKHILPKTKLNLHILSFRQTDRLPRRRLRLGFTQKLPKSRPNPKLQKLTSSRTSCVFFGKFSSFS